MRMDEQLYPKAVGLLQHRVLILASPAYLRSAPEPLIWPLAIVRLSQFQIRRKPKKLNQ